MSTLWHGRFEGGPAEELMAFTVSLPFDRRLAADDLDRLARARPGPGARRHPHRRPSATTCSPPSTPSRRSWRGGTLRVPAVRRGHPHRGRAAGHRAGRPGRSQAPHRPQPQRPGRHRPAPVRQARAGRRSAGRVARAPGGAARPGRRGRRRLPARLHPPPAGPAGAARPPPARPRLGAGARRRPPGRHHPPPRRVAARAPARWPARRCRSIPRPPPPTSASPGCSPTRSTR